jgi:hypothetical protein
MMTSGIKECCIAIEHQQPPFMTLISRSLDENSSMQWRINKNGHVQLKFFHKQTDKKLELNGHFTAFCTRLADGMMTLACPSKALQILISNADPAALSTFLRFISERRQHKTKCTIRQPACGSTTINKENLGRSNVATKSSSVLNRAFSKRSYQKGKTSSPAMKRGRRGSPSPKDKLAGPSDGVVLSDEQNRVLQLCLTGQSLFFTGCAGTGKSLLLKSAIKSLQATGKKVYPTSLTSVAACNIGGTTVHM